MHTMGAIGGPRRRVGLAGLLAALALAAGMTALGLGLWGMASFLPSLGNPFTTEEVDRSQPPVLQAIEDLSEYKAATGHFEVIVDVEERTRFVPGFLKGERTLFVAAGTVDATVDFSALPEGAIEVSEDGRSVTVTVPPAVLSEPRVDPDSSYVASRDRGVVDRVGGVFSDSPTGERELYRLAEDKLARAAASGDLRQRAETNTREMLEGMLASLGFDDVTVVFEESPA